MMNNPFKEDCVSGKGVPSAKDTFVKKEKNFLTHFPLMSKKCPACFRKRVRRCDLCHTDLCQNRDCEHVLFPTCYFCRARICSNVVPCCAIDVGDYVTCSKCITQAIQNRVVCHCKVSRVPCVYCKVTCKGCIKQEIEFMMSISLGFHVSQMIWDYCPLETKSEDSDSEEDSDDSTRDMISDSD